MSGTIVATPMYTPLIQTMSPFLAGAASGIAVGCAVVGVAASVRHLINMQAAAALAHQERERCKLGEWLAYQTTQAARMADYQQVETVFQESERKLAKMDLLLLAKATSKISEGAPEAPSSKSYLSLGAGRTTPAQVATVLEDLRQFIAALPKEFCEAKNSPYHKLVQHNEVMAAKISAGEPVHLRELTAFKEAIGRSLSGFRKDMAGLHAHRQKVNKRLETCLNEILFYEHLADSPNVELLKEHAELLSLKEHVVALIVSENVREGALELLEKKLATLKGAIDKEIICSAHRQQLPASLAAHLTDMGYEVIEDFAHEDTGIIVNSMMAIPGGERLHIALHRNGQMAFEVLHERSAEFGKYSPLTADETALIHKQEKRWCQDFRELVRRLAEEGFPFTVNLERALPMESVKVVVVETPESILAHGTEDRFSDEIKRGYLS